MNAKRKLTVGLLWHSVNSDNLGVGALTASHITILEKIATEIGVEIDFKVLGWRDPEPAYIAGENIRSIPLRARHLVMPQGLFSHARQCDFILDISAGDSFADIYGAHRFLFNVLSKAAVLLSGRPLILSPQTIGPFERWWTRLLATQSMRFSKKIVTRDKLSSAYVRELGLGDRFIEATDVAFRLPYVSAKRSGGKKTKVGLNVSGLLFNGGQNRKNMFSLSLDYPALVQTLCAHFTSLPDCELHLVGHVNSRKNEVEDDFRVAEKLAREFKGAVLAPRFAGPSEAKSYISGLDFFTGARMHACIAAFSSGVPVLPMAYSRKFAGLFGSIGYDHVVDCRKLSGDEIFKAVLDAYDRRGQLKQEVSKGNAVAQEKLASYEELLSVLMMQTTGKA